jgi:hypothetical protein
MTTRRSCASLTLSLVAAATAGCATMRIGPAYGYARPAQIVGEWVDVEKTSSADSSIWVLRADGYDGSLRLRVVPDSTGAPRFQRKETHYASWYFDGTLGDTAHQAICFSKRVGRFGATCFAFAMDTVRSGTGSHARILLRGYQGEHHTADRILVARQADAAAPAAH